MHQGVFDRLLAIGAVDFDNASAQQGDLFRFTGIARPHRVTNAINQVHEETATQGAPRSDVSV